MTLIEVLVSLVIVSVMLAAALQTVGAAARAGRVRDDRLTGRRLAEQLMGEILTTAFQEPGEKGPIGREAGEADDDRSTWDDIDDFDGWKAAPPVTSAGTPVAGAAGWERSALVSFVDPAAPDVAVPGPTKLKRIVVSAMAPDGEVVAIAALRSVNGLAEHEPAVLDDYLDSVSITLRAGDETTGIGGVTAVLNAIRVDAP